jgi:dTDP-4-amino-4,6-dideoxygalactose transaminase
MIQLFHPQYATEEILSELRYVLNSGWTGTGPRCIEFEKELGKFLGTDNHIHFLNSATSALHIALRLLDLPERTPVVSTALTFISTNAVILYEKMTPVFADINALDLSLLADDVLKKIEEHNAKAVIWVHYGGNVSSEFEKFMSLKPSNVSVIEDCAHAMGAKYADGSYVGSRKDTIACLSFQAVKNLPTADSGAIIVPTKEISSRVKKLSWLGIDKDTYTRTNNEDNEVYKWRYNIEELGWKMNGNDVMATIASVQLKHLKTDNGMRKNLYRLYREYLPKDAELMFHSEKNSSHHLVVIKSHKRDAIIKALKAKDIAPGVHYLPNYEFPILQNFYKTGDCPNTESLSKMIVSLPNHLRLDRKDIETICGVIHGC